jgi:hypothetical protein
LTGEDRGACGVKAAFSIKQMKTPPGLIENEDVVIKNRSDRRQRRWA